MKETLLYERLREITWSIWCSKMHPANAMYQGFIHDFIVVFFSGGEK